MKTKIHFIFFDITVDSDVKVEAKGRNRAMDKFLGELQALCRKHASNNGHAWDMQYVASEFAEYEPEPKLTD